MAAKTEISFLQVDSGYNTCTPEKAPYSEAIDQHTTEFVVLYSCIFVLFILLCVYLDLTFMFHCCSLRKRKNMYLHV